MQSQTKRHPLIVLIGPTAVGKTALSINLATRMDAEIISADSRLFYKGMDIGTAKPGAAEQGNIPHHLIDFLNPDENFSLGEFQQSVYRITKAIRLRKKLPIMVGGTGQYVRAITEGWVIPKLEPDSRLRNALSAQAEIIGTNGLHKWLKKLDPTSADRIDHRNLRRTIRALEVTLSTGLPFSEQRRTGEPRFETCIIGLTRPRDQLYQRVDERIEAMFAAGFISEVQSLLAAGYHPNLPAMSAIGYREVCEHLAGNISLDETIMLMKRRTRAYVRRQANWFKPADPAIHWVSPDEISTDKLIQFITSSLNQSGQL